MEVYLVGGAVRDKLLGLPVKERDYVVVGATEEEMREAGFRSVGKDFPVFLHPETNEEYALARTERKTGPGHQGFECHASPDVTLEDDLMRRDLTINAIAEDPNGQLIDPFDGQADIRAQILRHVSDAFREDPLRILRVARFQATFPDFSIHPETDSMMREMVTSGSLQELTPERVLLELDKALAANAPARFFNSLKDLGANRVLWPDVPDQAIENLRQLDSTDTETRFAALFSQLNEAVLLDFCRQYRCSNHRRDVTQLVIRHLADWRRLPSYIAEKSAEHIVKLLADTDAFRKRERFAAFNQICLDLTNEKHSWPELLGVALSVNAADVPAGITGPALGTAIREKRIDAIAEHLR